MKTIKIIDLLNKIANGEEVPKKIKYNEDIYIHVDNYCYFCEKTNEILSQNIYAEFSRLNDEVKIIEEEKELKKICLDDFCDITYRMDWELLKNDFNKNTNTFVKKINELIDVVNDLIKDGLVEKVEE